MTWTDGGHDSEAEVFLVGEWRPCLLHWLQRRSSCLVMEMSRPVTVWEGEFLVYYWLSATPSCRDGHKLCVGWHLDPEKRKEGRISFVAWFSMPHCSLSTHLARQNLNRTCHFRIVMVISIWNWNQPRKSRTYLKARVFTALLCQVSFL